MCTQTNDAIASDKPRSLSTLLALDTYQGMSDDEISMVLDYRISKAVSDREVLARQTAMTLTMEQVIADNRASADRAYDVVQSLLRIGVPHYEDTKPQMVSPKTVTPTALEV